MDDIHQTSLIASVEHTAVPEGYPNQVEASLWASVSPFILSVSITGCGRSQARAGHRCPLVAASQHCRHETEKSPSPEGLSCLPEEDTDLRQGWRDSEPDRGVKGSQGSWDKGSSKTQRGEEASARETSCNQGLKTAFKPFPSTTFAFTAHTQVHTDLLPSYWLSSSLFTNQN